MRFLNFLPPAATGGSLRLSLVCRALIAALWAPFRQWQALHGAEDSFLQIRVSSAQIIHQLLNLLPLGMLIHRAAVMEYRQILSGDEAVNGALVDIEHGTNLNDARSVQIRHRLEAADTPLIN